jgi:stage II sporulation protein D
MRPFAALLLSILFLLPASAVMSGTILASETIRVAIHKNIAEVTIDGDGILATRENSKAIALSAPFVIKTGKNCIIVENSSFLKLTVGAFSTVLVNGKPYRGFVEITPGENGLLVVNELPIEEYLVGLINSEISSAWPIEAVKAQAIIARTYAVNRKNARKGAIYHLESTVLDQVYSGSIIEDSRSHRAVSETSGEVLVYNGAVIQAFYHSNCGGKTEASENVWGMSLPYMKGVDCQYCLASGSSTWEQKLTLKEIEEKLKNSGFRVSALSDIIGGSRNNRGRLKQIVAISSRGETVIPGDQFRKAIGYGIIKSTNFTVKVANGEASFSGIGNGHGVGLCQWGSKQRALDGFGYTEILSYYYPGTDLKKLSDIR